MSRVNPRTTHGNAGIAAAMSVNVIYDAPVESYATALDLFEKVRTNIVSGKLSHKHWRASEGVHECDVMIASNVWLRDCEDHIAVVLYDSPVICYWLDDTFSVDNCGFNTPTTMERVTQFSPPGWYVYHEAKQLCLHGPKGQRIHPATHDQRVTA